MLPYTASMYLADCFGIGRAHGVRECKHRGPCGPEYHGKNGGHGWCARCYLCG